MKQKRGRRSRKEKLWTETTSRNKKLKYGKNKVEFEPVSRLKLFIMSTKRIDRGEHISEWGSAPFHGLPTFKLLNVTSFMLRTGRRGQK